VTKICSVCKEEKPLENFATDNRIKSGKSSKCKECAYRLMREWVVNNRERVRASSRKRYAKNPEPVKKANQKWQEENPTKRRQLEKKYRLRHPGRKAEGSRKWYRKNMSKKKAYTRQYHASNQQKVMWTASRARAKTKKFEFSILQNEIVIPEFCPVLGVPLEKGRKKSGPCSPTVDRIIPSKGYISGNVWVISHRANTIKSDATPGELRAIATAVEKIITERGLKA
jgi:hypothetical protein